MSSVWIKANDVLEDLVSENRRILSELVFANKCLKSLIDFKLKFDSNSSKIKLVFTPEEWQEFQDLSDNIKNTFDSFQSLPPNQSFGAVEPESSNASVVSDDLSPEDDSHLGNDLPKKKYKPRPKSKRLASVSDQSSAKLPSRVDFTPEGRKIIRRPNRKKQSLECTWPGCDYVAGQPNRLRAHLNEHKGVRPYVCNHDGCGKAFTSNQYLQEHKRAIHRERELTHKYQCEFDGCGKRFQRKYKYVEHRNKHLGLYQFRCHQCPDKRFLSENNLQRHIEVRHKVLAEPLTCDQCSRKFKTAMSFKVHQSIRHSGKEDFHCEEPNCTYKSPFKESVVRHQRTVHTKERPFVCPEPGCEKTFVVEKDVREHIRRCHVTERKYQCAYPGCDKAYKTSTDLDKHVQAVHSGKRLFCDWPGCDHSTTTNGSLKQHKILVHLGERNFKCQWPDCAKAFKSRSALTEHLRIHRNDKPFACTWPGCTYRSCNSSNLSKHIKIHNR